MSKQKAAYKSILQGQHVDLSYGLEDSDDNPISLDGFECLVQLTAEDAPGDIVSEVDDVVTDKTDDGYLFVKRIIGEKTQLPIGKYIAAGFLTHSDGRAREIHVALDVQASRRVEV